MIKLIVRKGEFKVVDAGITSLKEKYKSIGSRWELPNDIVLELVSRHEKEFERWKYLGFDNLLNLTYHRDRRTPEEYAYDIVEGWLIESLLAEWLKKIVTKLDPKAEVTINGSDKDRRIKIKLTDITTIQDVLITWSNGTRKKVEIQSSRKGRRKSYDHKKGKVKRAFEDNSVFLWVNSLEDEIFMVHPDDLRTNSRKKPNFAYGGKETYEFFLPEERYVDIAETIPYKYQEWLGFKKTKLRKKGINGIKL